MNRKSHILAHGLWGAAAIAGFGAIVMLLWNALVPDLFGAAAINFWQALGLLALCRVLFGGFGVGRKLVMGATFHRNPIREKWRTMTPAEREQFICRHHFGHRHGFGHDLSDDAAPSDKHD